jgi:hypothetical protein
MSARHLTARRKSRTIRNRVLFAETLEPRMLLSGNSSFSWSPALDRMMTGAVFLAAGNKAPTVAKSISVNNGAAVTGKTATLSLLGADDGGESKLLYSWSVMAMPVGGGVTLSVNGTNAAKNTVATFTKAGTYVFAARIIDAGGLSATSTASAAVNSTLSSIRMTTSGGTMINAGTTLSVAGASQSLVAQGLDQFGNVVAIQPTFRWSMTTAPSGVAAPMIAASGAGATLMFRGAGSYGLNLQAKPASGAAITRSQTILVTPVAASIVASASTVSTSTTTAQLNAPTVRNQFGTIMTAPSLTWTAYSMPTGATTPVFTTSGSVTTAKFSASGYYTILTCVTGVPSLACTTTVVVNQALTSLVVSPNAPSVLQGDQQQFTAQALDQFRLPMVNQQLYTWSTTAGTITTSGLLTAPTTGTSCTVTAKSGSISGQATVAVVANARKIQNATLASLVQSLSADGSINRADMLQILRAPGADGVVDATEFADLKQILCLASTLNIAGYVQVLAGDVVNGNLANQTYQGQTLGNLAAGSSSAVLNKLINKWFLGADHPTLCNTSLVYSMTVGSLFARTPSHNDEVQGQLGDCYLISALGTLADSNPAAVQNAIIDNGDGTFSVRFYTGPYGTIYNYSDGSISAGFTNNLGTVDYVTVDRMLPTSSSGMLAYANYGASCTNVSNTLWIPLIEKAYAQWNETGKAGRDGKNAYASIQGGWMATVDAQILGYNAVDYIMTSTSQQVAINALAAKKAVTIGTLSWSGTVNGLYPTHAYAIVGYNASTDTFTLYNPWGSNQPGPLKWNQLQSCCSQLAVANTSGSVAFGGVLAKTVTGSSPFAPRAAGLAVGMASDEAATAVAWESWPVPTATAGSVAGGAGASHALFALWDSGGKAEPCRIGATDADRSDLLMRLADATFADDILWTGSGALA